MARNSWFDDKAEHPMIQEQVTKLDSFTSALADGVVSQQRAGRPGKPSRRGDEEARSRAERRPARARSRPCSSSSRPTTSCACCTSCTPSAPGWRSARPDAHSKFRILNSELPGVVSLARQEDGIMKKLNRREFVQTTTAAGVAAAAIPKTLFGQAPDRDDAEEREAGRRRVRQRQHVEGRRQRHLRGEGVRDDDEGRPTCSTPWSPASASSSSTPIRPASAGAACRTPTASSSSMRRACTGRRNRPAPWRASKACARPRRSRSWCRRKPTIISSSARARRTSRARWGSRSRTA